MAFLETTDLCRRYGEGDAAVLALNSVSLSVEKGQFAAVTGRSGSGKSTLLHVLAGIDRPSSGRVIMDGTDLYALSEEESAASRRRKIGLVFQSYQLLPVLNVRENIELPLLIGGQKPDPAYLDELAAALDLKDRLKHLPSQLSGGQQQRAAIARALIARPDLILADEPTGNLDSENSKEVMSMLIRCVRQYGQTLVLVTHDASIASMADRVIRMQDGRIEEAGR